MKTTILFAALSLMLGACSDEQARKSAADVKEQTKKLTIEVAQLAAANSELKNQIKVNTDAIRSLDFRVATSEYSIINRTFHNRGAELKSTDKGYDLVVTEYGSFVVSVDNVVPYLDGNKITFSIGNLVGASITGGKISVKFGGVEPPLPSVADIPDRKKYNDLMDRYTAWGKTLRTVDTQITAPIASNSWNKVEVICAPSTPAGIAFLEVMIEPTEVNLAPGR